MKKSLAVIYSNKKIPQGQTLRTFDILLTRSLWKRIPSFILLWIFSRFWLVFRYKFFPSRKNRWREGWGISEYVATYYFNGLLNKMNNS